MKRMTLSEKQWYSLHNPSDLNYLLENALDYTNEAKFQDSFGTTSGWLIACRAENIRYQTLADYCY